MSFSETTDATYTLTMSEGEKLIREQTCKGESVNVMYQGPALHN